MAVTLSAGTDRKMIGKKTRLVVATMNISLMIANHTFMTAIFLVLLFLRQAQSYRIALIILTHKGEQLEKSLGSNEQWHQAISFSSLEENSNFSPTDGRTQLIGMLHQVDSSPGWKIFVLPEGPGSQLA